MNASHNPRTLTYELDFKLYCAIPCPHTLSAMTPEQIDKLNQAIIRLQPVLERFAQALASIADRIRGLVTVMRMRLGDLPEPNAVEDLSLMITYRYGGMPDDSASRDPHSGYCWCCNKIEVPSDPEHFGV